jgi:membrane fusion protein, multidrug efflux system
MTMKRSRKEILLFITMLAIAVTAAGIGYFYGRDQGAKSEEESKEEKSAPTAKVKAVALRQTTIDKIVNAYGSVTAIPGEIQTLNVPFESRVRRVRVATGQRVAAGTILVEVEPSSESLLQLEEAKANLAAAQKDLAQAQSRFDLKLITNQELFQAQNALNLAKIKLENLEQRRMQRLEIKAEKEALISKVDAQEGQIVPAGAALATLVSENSIEAILGVEPTDAPLLKPGQQVHLRLVHDRSDSVIDGRIRLIAGGLDPVSRLINVFVSLPKNNGFPLDSYVRGAIVVDSKTALAAPRSAVLPNEDKYDVFTIRNGRASRHTVTLGWQDGQTVEIIGGDLKAGDLVVIEGNYELEDDMPVELESQP